MVVPRGAMTMLAILALVSGAAWILQRRDWRPLVAVDASATCFLAIGLLGMASMLWQAAPAAALTLGAIWCANVWLGWQLYRWMEDASRDTHEQVQRAVILGFGIGLAYLLFEAASGLWLQRLAFNLIPELRPHPSAFVLRGDTVTKVRFEQINRGVALAMLLAWPVGLMVLRTKAQWGRPRLLGVLGTGTAILVATSGHESSKAALIVSVIIFALARFAPRVMPLLMRGAWIAAVMLVLPLALGLFQAKLHESAAIQDTGRARLIIWGYTAQQVLAAPILGVGAGAGKVLDEARGRNVEHLAGQPFDLRTGSHQHNVYLQTWYELGLAGAVLLLVAGWLMLQRIEHTPVPNRAWLYASFASCATMAGLSYGLWQAWFQASMVMACLCALCVVCAEEGGRAMPETGNQT
jgi:O-antigen ligase